MLVYPPGAVTIDLASEAGGNVETTVPGEVVKVGDVTCVGWTNMPGRIGNTASTLYGGNVTNLLIDMYDFRVSVLSSFALNVQVVLTEISALQFLRCHACLKLQLVVADGVHGFPFADATAGTIRRTRLLNTTSKTLLCDPCQ